jgi:outer membrane biosynthesis protein TonB
LVSSSLFPPEVYVAPSYPLIAQAAHVEGKITFTIEVDSKGIPGKATLLGGSRFLFSSVNAAVTHWKFAAPAFDQQIRVTLNYALNCPDAPK